MARNITSKELLKLFIKDIWDNKWKRLGSFLGFWFRLMIVISVMVVLGQGKLGRLTSSLTFIAGLYWAIFQWHPFNVIFKMPYREIFKRK